MSRRTSHFAISVCLALIASAAGTQGPQKLSSAAPPAGADVCDFCQPPGGLPYRVDPSEEHVVYVQDATTPGAGELWSTPLTGGTPTRLSSLLPSGSYVSSFEITPDGATVVYVAPQRILGVDELFRVPIGGGASVRLSDDLPAGADVGNVFRIAPDGSRVVYSVEEEVMGVSRRTLRSVPISGSAGDGVALQGAVAVGGSIQNDFVVDASSTSVVYRGDVLQDEVVELFSVPLWGGSVERLNPALVSGGDVVRFALAEGGQRVVYIADHDLDERFELFGVPSVGPSTAAVQLNDEMLSGGKVTREWVTPDAMRVVFGEGDPLAQDWKLWSVPADGSAAMVRVSETPVPGGNVFALEADDIRFVEGQDRVVYRARQRDAQVAELFSVPVDGPANQAVPMSTELPPNAIPAQKFVVTGDGERVIFDTAAFPPRVMSAAGTGAVRRLDPPLFDRLIGPRLATLAVHEVPPGAPMVIQSYDGNGLPRDLFAVPTGGGAAFRLNGPLQAETTERAGWASLLSDGRVVFLSNWENEGNLELWVTRPPTFADGFEWGHAWAWSSRPTPPACTQSACVLGAPGNPDCSERVATVCELMPSCCSTGWTSACLDLYQDMFLLPCL